MDQPPPFQMPMPPRPIDAATPLTVTLTAEEWNVVQYALHECAMPMKLARPVSDKIAQQTQAGVREMTLPTMPMMPPRPPTPLPGARDAGLSE